MHRARGLFWVKQSAVIWWGRLFVVTHLLITTDCLHKITLWYDGWAQVIYMAVILLCQKTKWGEGEETEGRNNPIFYGLMAPPTRTRDGLRGCENCGLDWMINYPKGP